MSCPSRPRILLLSAYDAGSHGRWRQQLIDSLPDFEWQSLTLSPRHFRWRIRGNPLSWLDAPAFQQSWDLLIATSTVDLATLIGLQPRLAQVPSLLYMHENQFAYPVSGAQHQSVDPQMVNLYSALAATRVAFNSEWNRQSFLAGVDQLMARLPDAVPGAVSERIRRKSLVLPVPIQDALFKASVRPIKTDCPHLLWNHRWEYDKGPDRLLRILDGLSEAGQEFRLSVVGEQFRQQPEAFAEIRNRHGSRLEVWGYQSDRNDYDRLLASADIVLSTALHDFQGLSMLEAMAAGCRPVAPDRLAYPEYVPDWGRYPSYPDQPGREAEGAVRVITQLVGASPESVQPDAWRLSALQPAYRDLIRQLLALRDESGGV